MTDPDQEAVRQSLWKYLCEQDSRLYDVLSEYEDEDRADAFLDGLAAACIAGQCREVIEHYRCDRPAGHEGHHEHTDPEGLCSGWWPRRTV